MKKLISLCLVCVIVMTLAFSASAVTLEDLKSDTATDYKGNSYHNTDDDIYNATSVVSQYATPTLDGVKDDCYSITSAMEANYCASGAFTNGTDGTSATMYSANDSEYLYLLLEIKQNVAVKSADAITLGVDFINTDNNGYKNGYTNYKQDLGFTDSTGTINQETFATHGGVIWAQPYYAPYGSGTNDNVNNASENGAVYQEGLTDYSDKWKANSKAAQGEGVTFGRTATQDSEKNEYGYVIEVRIALPASVKDNIAQGNDVVIGLFFRYQVNNSTSGTKDIGHFDVANDPAHFTQTNSSNLVKSLVRGYPAYHDAVISAKPAATATSTKIVAAQSTTVGEDKNYSVRFLAALNTAELANETIGFEITYNEKSIDKACDTVYNQIIANNGAKKYNALQLDGDYIFALEVTGLNADTAQYEFTVATYHYSNGEKVIDHTVTVTVSYDETNGVSITPLAK